MTKGKPASHSAERSACTGANVRAQVGRNDRVSSSENMKRKSAGRTAAAPDARHAPPRPPRSSPRFQSGQRACTPRTKPQSHPLQRQQQADDAQKSHVQQQHVQTPRQDVRIDAQHDLRRGRRVFLPIYRHVDRTRFRIWQRPGQQPTFESNNPQRRYFRAVRPHGFGMGSDAHKPLQGYACIQGPTDQRRTGARHRLGLGPLVRCNRLLPYDRSTPAQPKQRNRQERHCADQQAIALAAQDGIARRSPDLATT